MKKPAVYILASQRNGTLYTGVTSNLIGRIHQHREGTFRGFNAKHEVKLLVWFEGFETMDSAIAREKQLKNWQRRSKLDLIENANPRWRDLAEDFGFPSLRGASRQLHPAALHCPGPRIKSGVTDKAHVVTLHRFRPDMRRAAPPSESEADNPAADQCTNWGLHWSRPGARRRPCVRQALPNI
ncbi:GIY-YIG nuclease family protein [Blastomonas aquatica]|uniref:GIY-YIG domain-containing protein n=1 Tax=Blastomonas aquatica TaxID=1510276 RepID=A0ABQ1JDT5_9SPHN|nr:GIY-YIG nuclease family protein [Blastomonas aquatica]GGB64362.1 hypothetical protein GCM10010833_19320 [Blastomonas aquatica]